MAKTEEYLAQAFAGESQANRKYLAFAEKADQEGFAQVAKLFRAAAASETVHAHNHLKALGGIKSTAENLEAAMGGETFEFTDMYPPMIEAAKSEDNAKAQKTFEWANAVEKVHAELYQKAADQLGKNAEVDYYVCGLCGYTAEGEAPDKCPVCGAAKKKFSKID